MNKAKTGEDSRDGADTVVGTSAFAAPPWARDAGRWSWIIVGIGLVLVSGLLVLAAIRLIVLAALFAILFAGTFLPVVDWLERHRLRRWMGALTVLVMMVALAVLVTFVIAYGVVNQVPQIQQHLDDAQKAMKSALSATSVPQSTVDSARSSLESLLKNAAGGAAGALVGALDAVASLLFGVFISINIMVWMLIQGRRIGAWASRHLYPVPQPVAYRIFADSTRFFRGYIWGSTIVGLFNAGVLFVGALVIGVPLAGTIAIVAWITNYIPYFGAIISGAFAVLIAVGAGGPSMAIPMLIIVVIANGFLQTLVSQFALGSALDLHPLAVLFATTAGGILAGAVGGVFAAPFLKIGVDAYGRLRNAGLFGQPPPVIEPQAGETASAGGVSPPEEVVVATGGT
jgi:putative heme transporter